MDGVRYANIGIAVGTTFILAGVLLFKSYGDAVIQAIGVMGFIFGAVVYRGLDERNERRERRRDQ